MLLRSQSWMTLTLRLSHEDVVRHFLPTKNGNTHTIDVEKWSLWLCLAKLTRPELAVAGCVTQTLMLKVAFPQGQDALFISANSVVNLAENNYPIKETEFSGEQMNLRS